MLKNYIISFFIILNLLACNSSVNKTTFKKNENIDSPEEIYAQATNLFDKNNLEVSMEKFKLLKKLYPLSNEAIQAEVMIGFIYYLEMDYESSIFHFNKLITKYPSHKDLDYFYYMRAVCNYEQITNPSLDGKFNELALDGFNQVIKRFPDSKYASDSRQKIILVKSNKAAKFMEIGKFYLSEKKYTAALNRFKVVIEEYSTTKFTPEALHRMVEAYYYMGMEEDSIKTASILGHNYPNSKWYKYSYNLIKKIENKDSLFEKVKNIF